MFIIGEDSQICRQHRRACICSASSSKSLYQKLLNLCLPPPRVHFQGILRNVNSTFENKISKNDMSLKQNIAVFHQNVSIQFLHMLYLEKHYKKINQIIIYLFIAIYVINLNINFCTYNLHRKLMFLKLHWFHLPKHII